MNFIPISQPSITQKEVDYVTDAVKSGWVSSLGSYIDLFEEKYAWFCGVKYAIATCNATVGLHLAMVALGIGRDDEVIVPDLTFIATANAVKYTGANVVIADVDRDTLCISVDSIKKSITSKTKAIIPVHLYGHPADMLEINNIAKDHKIFVIEDAAEAHGASIGNKKVGSFGDVSVFSFYGNKIITSGEGGMITTDNEELFKKMKFLRDHAMSKDKRYWHTEVGFNYRMTNLQAALGLAQFERIEELISKKVQIYNWYKEELESIDNIRLNFTKNGYSNVYWMVCLELLGKNEDYRNDFMIKLKERNIDSRPYFYPMSDMPMYEDANTPISHKVSSVGLNLPSYFDMTRNNVIYICKTIKDIICK